MGIKKISQFFLCGLSLLVVSQAKAQHVINSTTQIIHINTAFSSIIGSPSWLLIVRDLRTGRVLPYLYEIRNNDNFWIAFTGGRSYRITASSLKFGPYAKISNFCHLENGTINGESYTIRISGELSPNPRTFKCFVYKYKNPLPFTIVPSATETITLETITEAERLINQAAGGATVLPAGPAAALPPGQVPPAGGAAGAQPAKPVPDQPLPYIPIDTSPSMSGIVLTPVPDKPFTPVIAGAVH